ncbi:hypothetical protein PCANC_21402 [Puccinia coronata f. sp. avenae]|uniref:Uncharacterized protein n=1 Tax=Puccinia coronata f. sp. avenae TaxID=200324 RepID=A0A2N5UTE0_9BASI|nr:hypothetical protein PCANC_21402 [Puccinia coronata f. sp. avenae]
MRQWSKPRKTADKQLKIAAQTGGTFQTPTKPIDYVSPCAWNKPAAGPGRSLQPPAGRPPIRAASVAGITVNTPHDVHVAALTVDAAIEEARRFYLDHFDNEGCFPLLSPAAIAAIEALDAQRWLNEANEAKQACQDLANIIAAL